jgi:hypothetical protein
MRVTAAVIVILLSTEFASAGIIPVGRPDTDKLYSYTRELYLRGYGNAGAVLFAPINNTYINCLLNEPNLNDNIIIPLKTLAGLYDYEKSRLSFQTTIVPYGIASNKQKKGYFSIIPQLCYSISPQISIAIAYRIDSHLAHDLTYDGKKWQNFAGYADLATASYRGKKLSLDIGRRRTNWGIAHDSNTLMHSALAMPVDGLFFGYKLAKYLSFHSTIAYLSPIKNDSLSAAGNQTENRYFSAHALCFSPSKWLDFTLKEAVVYGGAGRPLEAYYVSPLLWYHAEQLNSSVDDNTFLGMDAIVRFNHKFAGYSEFLIDDWQIDKKGGSDREPGEYGLIVGMDIFDFPKPTSNWEIEYTKIANRTYNQLNPRNKYLQHNLPLGYPLGPDNQSLGIVYNNHLTTKILLSARYRYQQQGEGRIDGPWLTPWLDNPDYKEEFPSGVVEKISTFGFEFYYQKNAIWQCKLSGDFADIKNDNNVLGKSKRLWRFNYEFICNLPHISWRLEDE